MTWERITSQGRTVYHGRRLTDLRRLTVRQEATGWSWGVYDRATTTRGWHLTTLGTAHSWQAARAAAENAAGV